jgi:hypothetical protein
VRAITIAVTMALRFTPVISPSESEMRGSMAASLAL